jgi:hypothetical protein
MQQLNSPDCSPPPSRLVTNDTSRPQNHGHLCMNTFQNTTLKSQSRRCDSDQGQRNHQRVIVAFNTTAVCIP